MKNKLSFLTFIGIFLFSISAIGQPYCSSSYTLFYQDYVSNVNFNTINNASFPTAGYSDFTALSTDISLGIQYNLTTTIVNFDAGPNYVMAWIDWNQDFDFNDVGEAYSLGIVTGPTVGTNVVVSITVPTGATLGTTRMRISVSGGFVPTPCNSGGYLYGETEDYSVNVVSPPLVWDGEVDNDWDNPLNWNPDIVPSASDPVTIPGGAPRYPEVNGVLSIGASFNPYHCGSLVIQSGASVLVYGWGQISIFNNVVVNSGGSLTVNRLLASFGGGLYINGGTVTVNQLTTFANNAIGNMNGGSFIIGGTLEFATNASWNTSSGEIISMGSSNTLITNYSPNINLYNLTIESGGTASLSGDSEEDIFIFGSLTVEPNSDFTMEEPTGAGNVSEITIAQNLNLEGNLSGKASFISENGSTILTYGTTSVASYYAEERWHFISSPVTSAVSGVFQDLYLKAFDEPTNSYTPSPGITSTTYPLGVGQGFETFSDVGNGSPTIYYSGGQLNNGDLSPNFTATDIDVDLSIGDGEGWNLIGNPYPSAIDIGTENDPVSGYSWTNIDSTIYAWNGVSWSSFNMAGNGTGVNSGTRYIPSMQAFFLKANDFNPVFSFANSARLHSAQANYKSSVNDDFNIKMIISGNEYSDEMIVRAIDNATDLFDSKYDAYKLPGLDEVPSLYSKAGSADLSINTIAEFTEETVVPIYLKVGNQGIYKIEAGDFDLSEIGLEVYLEDLKENYIAKLDGSTQYEFSAEPNNQEYRFNLIFKNKVIEDLNSDKVQIFSSDNVVFIRKNDGLNTNVFVYDMMGREVSSLLNTMDNELELQVANGTGNYIVRVVTSNYIETKKVFIK